MKIIPINNGYFNYKSADRKIFKARLEKSICNGITSGCDSLTIDNESYIVGEGSFCIDRDKTLNDKFTRILILNMLAKFMNNGKEEFNIILSTPPKMFKHQSKKLPEYLKGEYKIIYNAVEKNIIINKVKVYPETFIVYLNHQDKYKDKNLIIWDIGGFTTNVVLIRNGSFTVNDFITLEHGMYHLDEEIIQYLSSVCLDHSFNNIDDIQYMRNENNIILENNMDYINKLYDKHIKEIIEKIELKGWNYQLYENLCTGGGCKILFNNIKKQVKNAELSEDALFDNFKALEKLAIKEISK